MPYRGAEAVAAAEARNEQTRRAHAAEVAAHNARMLAHADAVAEWQAQCDELRAEHDDAVAAAQAAHDAQCAELRAAWNAHKAEADAAHDAQVAAAREKYEEDVVVLKAENAARRESHRKAQAVHFCLNWTWWVDMYLLFVPYLPTLWRLCGRPLLPILHAFPAPWLDLPART